MERAALFEKNYGKPMSDVFIVTVTNDEDSWTSCASFFQGHCEATTEVCQSGTNNF